MRSAPLAIRFLRPVTLAGRRVRMMKPEERTMQTKYLARLQLEAGGPAVEGDWTQDSTAHERVAMQFQNRGSVVTALGEIPMYQPGLQRTQDRTFTPQNPVFLTRLDHVRLRFRQLHTV